MSSVAPALAPTNIISIILNSSQHQAVTLPKQIVRTCASCCVQQAQPFRVLGRNAPASLSSARFNTRHTSGTDVTRPLSNQRRTRYKPAAGAFAPATHDNRTGIALR